MNKLRITAVLLLTLAFTACAGSPTGPTAQPGGATASLDGQGLMGGGTRAP